jgi:hypothetical protein
MDIAIKIIIHIITTGIIIIVILTRDIISSANIGTNMRANIITADTIIITANSEAITNASIDMGDITIGPNITHNQDISTVTVMAPIIIQTQLIVTHLMFLLVSIQEIHTLCYATNKRLVKCKDKIIHNVLTLHPLIFPYPVPQRPWKKTFYRFILSVLVLLAFFTSYASAESTRNSPSTYYQTSDQQDSISEQAAVAIAQKKINGRVLAIRRINNIYRIKILSNQSTVHIVAVDAINGTILSSH